MRSRGIAAIGGLLAASLVAAILSPLPAGAREDAPPAWDPRIEALVRFVEEKRGLEFRHPVRVRFQSERAFRRVASSWYDDPSTEDRDLAELEGGDLVALGLAPPSFDALESYEESDVEDTLGFYDSETGEMVVRGTRLADVSVRVTVVHELVHALQDQHFDLDALERRTRSAGESAALSALIEGDATRVEYEYLRSLPESEQDAY